MQLRMASFAIASATAMRPVSSVSSATLLWGTSTYKSSRRRSDHDGYNLFPQRYIHHRHHVNALAYTSFASHRNCLNRQRQTRLFGCKPDIPNAKPGHIDLSDDRTPPPNNDGASKSTLLPINLPALHRTIETTRDITGYPTYDVSLSLIDNTYMQELNQATRGIDSTTDILSFCFQTNFIKPGVLGDVQFDLADYYNLGDMLIDVDYVMKKCEDDRRLHAEQGREGGPQSDNDELVEGEVISEQDNSDEEEKSDNNHYDSDDEYEYEYMEIEVDEYDDRGIAPNMQYIYDPEIRIHMLVVHGMLHLVGYDHIDDNDYELMVVREDEVLAELKRRLGDDFGLGRARALPMGEVR